MKTPRRKKNETPRDAAGAGRAAPVEAGDVQRYPWRDELQSPASSQPYAFAPSRTLVFSEELYRHDIGLRRSQRAVDSLLLGDALFVLATRPLELLRFGDAARGAGEAARVLLLEGAYHPASADADAALLHLPLRRSLLVVAPNAGLALELPLGPGAAPPAAYELDFGGGAGVAAAFRGLIASKKTEKKKNKIGAPPERSWRVGRLRRSAGAEVVVLAERGSDRLLALSLPPGAEAAPSACSVSLPSPLGEPLSLLSADALLSSSDGAVWRLSLDADGADGRVRAASAAPARSSLAEGVADDRRAALAALSPLEGGGSAGAGPGAAFLRLEPVARDARLRAAVSSAAAPAPRRVCGSGATAPDGGVASVVERGGAAALEAVSLSASELRSVELGDGAWLPPARDAVGRCFAVREDGLLRVFETESGAIEGALARWKTLVGYEAPPAAVSHVSTAEGPAREPRIGPGEAKHGREDPSGAPHVGGNTWAGGSGGSDTAGLGGRFGPYRLDGGHPVQQVPESLKGAPTDEAAARARAMAEAALRERLEGEAMGEEEWAAYEGALERIRAPLGALRRSLEALRFRGGERVWARHAAEGEVDEDKLAESVAGERNVYKRRERPEEGGEAPPAQLRIVVDVSASMYRFDGADGRLRRLVDTAALLLEAFGDEERFEVTVFGHSGDSARIPLVEAGGVPRERRKRAALLRAMRAHAQFCASGDHTVEATRTALRELRAADGGGGALCVVISDANLERYGIDGAALGKLFEPSGTLHAHFVMIASLGEQAAQLQRQMPEGRAHVCEDPAELPRLLGRILRDFVERVAEED